MDKKLLFGLMLLMAASFAADWALSPDGKYVYWGNANALINCTATSNGLINQEQICNFTYYGAATKTLNTSLAFNLADGVKPKAAYLWQNISHTLYSPVSTPVNHTVIITPIATNTTTAACNWGAGATKRRLYQNISDTTGSVFCFDGFINNSGTYTIWSMWNEDMQTPYTAYYYDWNDVTGNFVVSQFGSWKVGTIEASWTAGTSRLVKFEYSTKPNSAGKFDIYFHTNSAQDAISNPSNIVLVLDPWWNSTYKFKIPIVVNSTINANLTNFPARIPLNTSNITLWNTASCTNVRFTNQTDNGELLYDLDSPSLTYCGNTSNNAVFYVLIPHIYNLTGFDASHNNTIYAYLGNVNGTGGENERALWGNASAAEVWHMERNGTGAFPAMLNNPTFNLVPVAGTTQCNSTPSGNGFGFGVNITTWKACYMNTSSGITLAPLPNGTANRTMVLFMQRNGYHSGGEAIFTYGDASTNQIFGLGTGAAPSGYYRYKIDGYVNDWTSLIDITNRSYVLAAARYNGTARSMYQNGSTTDFNTQALSMPATGKISYGNYWWASGYEMNGTEISEIRIYSTYLSDDRLSAEAHNNPIFLTIEEVSIIPSLTVQSPTNTTYNIQTIDLNFTTDSNAANCWYSLDGGANTTLAACANTTLTSLSQGSHSVSVYANSSTGGTNTSTVAFSVDSIAPSVAIQNPTNTTYLYSAVNLNLTVSDGGSGIANCNYSVDGGAAVLSCANTTLILGNGNHSIFIQAADNLGNTNSTSVSFTIAMPAIIITINSPANYTYSSGNISIRYLIINATNCWYSLDGANTTLSGCNNGTMTGVANGSHSFILYTNNSYGNLNYSVVYFTVNPNNPTNPQVGLNPMFDEASRQIGNIVGSPILAGLIILIFFSGWVAVSGMKTDAKIITITLAMFLAFALLPTWIIRIGYLIIALFVMVALLKLFERW
jgi:hypothetical protein